MTPKTSFILVSSGELSEVEYKSLNLLYQPIIGATANSLISLLWQLSAIDRPVLRQHSHSKLLSFLSISSEAFYRARIRLEGTGLLKTLQPNDDTNHVLIYQLIRPLRPAAFFKEDLLSICLLQILGKDRYLELGQSLLPAAHQFGNFHDVSKNFFDVFHVNPRWFADSHRDPTKIKSQSRPHASLSNYDQNRRNRSYFAMLLQVAKGQGVDLNSLNHYRKLIMDENALYGIDYPMMARFVRASASYVDNKVDPVRLKIMISDHFQGNSYRPGRDVTGLQRSESIDKRPESATQARNENKLLKVVYRYAPVPFLKTLKKALDPHWVTTYPDENVVKRIMEYHAFRDNREVINVMIYYFLVDQKDSSLSFWKMSNLVSDWSYHGVNTPREALQRIHDFYETSNKHSKGKYNYRNKVLEKLPNWENRGYKYDPNHDKADPKTVRKSKLIMKRLKAEKRKREEQS